MRKNRTTVINGLILAIILLASMAAQAKGKPWDPPPYFAPEHYAQVEGMKICYLEAGEQNPQAIVFIHGFSGDVQNWWDQYEYFKSRYHVVVIDDPGHGKSERRKDIKYSMALDGKTVIGLMDFLGIKQAIVAGNSMGGHIAAWVAINYPDRVTKLVLSDAAGASDMRGLALLAPLVNPVTMKSLGYTSGKQYKPTTPQNQARSAFIKSFDGTGEGDLYLDALAKSIKDLVMSPIKKDLPKIKAETLLIWGDNDPTVNPKVMDTFARLIPNTKRYLVPQGGHTPHMDKPAEFNCAVEKFIQGKDMNACPNAQ
jgi:pimeloyl-ACP methyl ester carboxylesterase